MAKLPENPWAMTADAVCAALETDATNGLTEAEARARTAQFGRNELPIRRGAGPIKRFLLQFHQPLVYILLAAVFVTAALGEWVDAGVIFGVVVVNALIGFVQEAKAIGALEALQRTMTSQAVVRRGGQKREVRAAELVPGDLVMLSAGDRVPADVRLVWSKELRTDEASLTGESVPSEKRATELPADTVLADRDNMAFSSSLVTFGAGSGVVVRTGAATEIGRISELVAHTEQLATPLTRKLERFARVLLFAILGTAAVTAAVMAVRGHPAFDIFMGAIALAVGAIPEGLPAAMTIMLAIGVNRMARRQAIIRRLPAVETLGSTTVICSDKTGTLTQNAMTVCAVVVGDARIDVEGTGYVPEGGFARAGEALGAETLAGELPGVLETLRAGILCNDSRLRQEPPGESDGRKPAGGGWVHQGDPTEVALIVAAYKAGLRDDALAESHPRLDAIPFDSEYQYMATLHAVGDARVVYVKGSPERVLAMCRDAIEDDGRIGVLDAERALRHARTLASEGLRVLGCARLELGPPGGAVASGGAGGDAADGSISHASIATGLTFLGLQGMLDPPRPEAIDAVRACHRAGIVVKMITGDHADTAVAIAEQLGIVRSTRATGAKAVTGRELADISDEDLTEVVKTTHVFARMTPEQKLRLVEALQRTGEIVAMTGDGVNDAPALRRADIGIAMGISGTEVAKEASAMVLTDDNFASIVAAVEEGRAVYDNLRKFVVWTLPTNAGQALVVVAAALLGTTLIMLPVQILWLNMTTALALGLMLVFEPKETDVMARAPRPPTEPLLDRQLVLRILIVGVLLLIGADGLFQYEMSRGATLAEARTVAASVFVSGQTFYLFNCRSMTRSVFSIGFFTNPLLLVGCATMAALQLAFTYVPFMNTAFGSAPLPLESWGRIAVVGLVIFVVIGVEKRLRRRGEPREEQQLATTT
jgi:Ca2+-transporting ATPase